MPIDNHPSLDPTDRTTQVVLREIAALKEIIFTRLDAMDLAIELSNDNFTRVPTETDKQIAHLKELMFQRFGITEEKFISIQTQFKERDVRSDQTLRDSKVAVDAALQAAKEAVGEQNKSSALAIAKSEASTAKQIDQQSTLIYTNTKSLDEKIGDMKDRLILIEGKDTGKKLNREDNLGFWAILIAAGSFVLSLFIKFK